MKNNFIQTVFIISLLISFQNLTFAQNFEWAKNCGNGDANGVSTDNAGNYYVVGRFYGSSIFGTFTLTSYGGDDVFLAKYDNNGNCIWVQKAGGTGHDNGFGVVNDNSGNIFITGIFRGTATFGSFTVNSSGDADVFIAKYDNNGNCIWVQRGGGTNIDYVNGITIDVNGNVFIGGGFFATANFGSFSLSSSGDTDIFFAKYNTNGVCLRAIKAGGSGYDLLNSIITDNKGYLYFTGEFRGTSNFGSISVNSNGHSDVFIAKYDSSGNCIWARNAGGSDIDIGNGITVDNERNVFITGNFLAIASFGSFTLVNNSNLYPEIFIAKYDSTGICRWAKKAGGEFGDLGNAIKDINGNVLITGYFYGTATFGSFSLTSAGSSDIFVAKYDSSGNCIWAQKAGGTSNDKGSSIIINSNLNIFVAGTFTGTATFGSISLTNRGGFITKLSDVTNIDLETNNLPNEYILEQNYPNPFGKAIHSDNPSTVISYQLPVNGKVSLKVYDILGNEIATLVDEYKEAGRYDLEFNVGQTISLSTGVYIYRLTSGNFTTSKKMIILK